MAGLEPARAYYSPTDFKSVASTIPPHRRCASCSLSLLCTGENEFATKRDILGTLANALIERSIVEKIDVEWRDTPNGYEHKISAPIILLRKDRGETAYLPVTNLLESAVPTQALFGRSSRRRREPEQCLTRKRAEMFRRLTTSRA